VSIVAGRHIGDRRRIGSHKALGALIFGSFLLLILAHIFGSAALGAQTREQCDKCCQGQSSDEYYTEQLRCFRNPTTAWIRNGAARALPTQEVPPRQPESGRSAPQQPQRPAQIA
jgi:hypothetical protein